MHESYESEIAPAVAVCWVATAIEDDGTSLRTMKNPDAAFCAKVTWELFNELSEEEQGGLQERTKEDVRVARKNYVKSMKDGPSKSPEDRQPCVTLTGIKRQQN
jgi:hypothetical protein